MLEVGTISLLNNESKVRGTYDFPIELYHVDQDFPKYHMPLHWHMEHELLRMIKGELRLSLNEQNYLLTQGDIVFINSGTLHAATPNDAIYQCIVYDMHMLQHTGSSAQRIIRAFAGGELAIHPLAAREDPALGILVNGVFDALQQEMPGFELSVHGLLLQMLGNILQSCHYTEAATANPRSRKKAKQVKQVLNLVTDAYAGPLTLDDMAKAACMSPKYFCQFFREMTHETPIDYLNHYRVERAAEQMIATDCTVTEAAYECGFHDLSYFIRTFKKYKGTTPRKYRQRFE